MLERRSDRKANNELREGEREREIGKEREAKSKSISTSNKIPS